MGENETALPTDVVAGLSSSERSTWLKTGELPGSGSEKVEVKEEKSGPGTPGDNQEAVSSEAKVSETKNEPVSEAGGKAGEEPKKVQVQGERKKSPYEKRVESLLGQVKDREREIARLKSESAKREEKVETKEPKVEAGGMVRPKPTTDDKKLDGTAKYSTYEEFVEDLSDWKSEQRVKAALDERFAKEYESREKERKDKETSERDSKIAEANKVIAELWSARVGEARKRYGADEFDSVALDEKLPIKEGTVVDSFILDSEYGTDVLYYLATNPEELDRINTLTPIAQARELTKIELKFTKEPEPAPTKKDDAAAPEKEAPAAPAPRQTRPLPPPMREVGGRGTQVSDPVTSAGIAKDFTAYKQAANLRDLQSRKRA